MNNKTNKKSRNKKLLEKYKVQAVVGAIIAVLVIAIGIYVLVSNSSDSYSKLADEAIFTSGDYSMRYDEAYFLTKNKQAYYEAYYLSSDVDLDWNAEYEDGKTFGQVVLNESLDFAKEIFIFSEYAKANGITISEAELKSIESEVATFFKESGTKIVNATKANSDVLKRVYIRTAYHDKLCDKIYSEASLEVDEDEMRQCLIAAVELGPKYFDSPKETAEAIMNRVNSGEVITEVAQKYDTKAMKGNVGKGTMDGNALEKLCLSLKNGECNITEIEGTYFVVYCYLAYDEEATEYAVEQKLEELKAEAVAKYYEELLKDMPVTVNEEAWSTINFGESIFTEADLEGNKS